MLPNDRVPESVSYHLDAAGEDECVSRVNSATSRAVRVSSPVGVWELRGLEPRRMVVCHEEDVEGGGKSEMVGEGMMKTVYCVIRG